MTRAAIAACALLLGGCATMERILQPRTPTPEERAQQMYLAYIGLLMMQQANQPVGPPPSRIYVINGRQIVCSQMNNVVVCN